MDKSIRQLKRNWKLAMIMVIPCLFVGILLLMAAHLSEGYMLVLIYLLGIIAVIAINRVYTDGVRKRILYISDKIMDYDLLQQEVNELYKKNSGSWKTQYGKSIMRQ